MVNIEMESILVYFGITKITSLFLFVHTFTEIQDLLTNDIYKHCKQQIKEHFGQKEN